jgi:hypothetical protein
MGYAARRPMGARSSLLLWVVAGATALAADAAAQPVAPFCRPAPVPEYGRSVDHPVQVGGGPRHGPARERRYLESLTGPAGQTLSYKRTGSVLHAGDDVMIDHYEVTYTGLPTPFVLYLDEYHVTEQYEPVGLRCARAPELGTPPVDEFLGGEQLRAHAVAVAQSPGFRAGPIDLDADGSAGFVVDQHRLLSRRLRSGAKPPTPEEAMKTPATVVAAFPRDCAGTSTSPITVTLANGRGASTEPEAVHTDAAAVRQRLPAPAVPPGTVVATFAVDALQFGIGVRIAFPAPCPDEVRDRFLPIAYQPAELLHSPMPVRPAGEDSGVAWVAVQAVIDHLGEFQRARALGGPPPLVDAALKAVAAWKARPKRANGQPVASPVVLRVEFTAATP